VKTKLLLTLIKLVKYDVFLLLAYVVRGVKAQEIVLNIVNMFVNGR
jgi:hypothetical protein